LINADSASQLLAAFTTVFFILAIGFGARRLRLLSEETLSQLARLVVDVLLPVFLFYTPATSTDLAAISVAPLVVVLGVGIPLFSLLLAVISRPLVNITPTQKPVFRFSAMVGNTAFLGIPICAILFGSTGVVYAVLFDFGTTLVILTVGIWVLSGGQWGNLSALLMNPLILGVIAGLLWVVTGWQFPEWASRPCSTLGDATLPMALLVAGAHLGNIHVPSEHRWQPIAAVTAIRLLLAPGAALVLLHILPLDEIPAAVVVIQAAMPVGLTVSIMVKGYGMDAGLAASSTLWSTLALIMTLPLLAIFVL
jgi:hypothetical protein